MKTSIDTLIKYLMLLPVMGLLFLLTISFKADDKRVNLSKHSLILKSKAAVDSALAFGEIQTNFPGGKEGYNKFVNENAKYPASAKESKIMGCAYIQFIIEKDGSLNSFLIFRDPGSKLGDEALRLLKASPNWIPTMKDGKPVKSKCIVPVNFVLDKDFNGSVNGAPPKRAVMILD